jgi:hypothetical protein
MTLGDPKTHTIGFLTVVEHQQQGLVGGYLILNISGRPLEFHCTAPVKPNRAQQILFGPTLDAYLYGEQIGQTLVNKGSLEPLAICTDVELALSVRDYVAPPVALVLAAEVPTETPIATEPNSVWRVEPVHALPAHLTPFSLGRNRLAVPPARDEDRTAIAERLQSLVNFDLSEPFSRIREAVEEAHKGNRAA